GFGGGRVAAFSLGRSTAAGGFAGSGAGFSSGLGTARQGVRHGLACAAAGVAAPSSSHGAIAVAISTIAATGMDRVWQIISGEM
ncbi:hypothetical protein, partial [Variovorax sp.]|uniref:hypothetical protein n=1 Tax=Variovorax sp. TaxID=1871043 RepID=UPI004037B7F0